MNIKLLLSCLTTLLLLASCTTVHKLPPNKLFSEPGKYISPDGKSHVTIKKESGETITWKAENLTDSPISVPYPFRKDRLIMCWDGNSTLWTHRKPGYVGQYLSFTESNYVSANIGIGYGNNLEWLEEAEYSVPTEFKKALIESARKYPYIPDSEKK